MRSTRLVAALLVLAAAALGALAVGRPSGGRAAPAAATGGTTTAPATPAAPAPPPLPKPIPGYLLIADRGNDRLLLVDNRKRILWRYPAAGRTPAMPFVFDDDAFFGPDLRRIVSNQEDQQTIQVLSFPQGRLLWQYGHVNVRSSAPGYLNTPDDAYLLPNGLLSVADAYNCRILFIAPSHRVVRTIGGAGNCAHAPPRALGAVNAGTPLPGGGTLVSEIAGWVDAFGPSGRLLWTVRAPVSYPSDPQWLGHGKILLADYARPGHVLIIDRHGRVLWRYGPSSGPGMLDHPSLALRLRSGLIAVNDDYRDRVVLIDVRTRRIVWQYGHTGVAGSRPGYLNTPDGMDLLPFRRALATPAIRALLVRVHALRRRRP
jgi:outer membrane protein assembly factor BamB